MSAEGKEQAGAASETQVLIVGAGPAGLFAASELLRHGVRPRIVERKSSPHHETRGTAIQPAVLETLEKGGVLAPFLETSVRIKEVEVMGPGLQRISLGQLAGLGCAYEFQCSQPQWRTEAVLRDHLMAQGLAVEFDSEVAAIAEADDRFDVTLKKGGATEVLRASYLVGADGGHSSTRHSMQERLDGETYGGRYIVADAKLGLACPAGRARIVVGPAGFVLMSPLPEGRWLIFVNRDEAEQSAEPPDAAGLATLLNARIGIDVGLTDLRWISYFLMHKRSAPRLSDGRRFLLGDAAHLSSPMGGEGINSALMDGADIAWKLGLVLAGSGKSELLDSYAIERGLADHHVVEVSNDIHGFVMDLIAQARKGEPITLPIEDPEQRPAGMRKRSMLDVTYLGSPLIDGSRGAGAAAGERYPAWRRLKGAGHHLVVSGAAPDVETFRARWGRLVTLIDDADLGRNGADGLVLVRPDGFVGFRRAKIDTAAMDALDAHLSKYLRAAIVAPEAGQARIA